MKGIKTNNEIELKVLELYNQGVNCLQIVNTLKIAKQTIKKVLLNNGIDYTLEKAKEKKEKLRQVIKLYSEGISQLELEKRLKLTRKTIRETLQNSEVIYRTKSQAITLGYGHYIDENVFDDLTNPEALYFIGLLYTDGHISERNNQNCIEIKLQSEDLELLEKLKKFLKCNYDITKTKNEESYRLRFFSKKIISILKDIGFTSNKTSSLIPDERLKHSKDFWRGCVDGDGCLSLNNGPYPYWIINLVGTKDTCQGFIDFVSENGIKNNRNPNKSNGKDLYIGVFAHQMGLKVAKLLYENAIIYMERKYNKYLEIKEFYKV